MIYVFDLDGTLLDTYAAVREAYRLAGADPPSDFWGKPWHAWLDDPAVHKRKNEIYRHVAKTLVRPLPFYHFIERLESWHFYIMTAGSPDAVEMLTGHFDALGYASGYFTEVSLADRIEALKALDNAHGTGLYVDDDATTCREIKLAFPDWQVTCVL